MDQKALDGFLHAINEVEHILKRFESLESEDGHYLSSFGYLFRASEAETGSAKITMTDIARRLHVTKPAVTYIIKGLTERGLVQRVDDPQDHRITYIAPTDLGKQVFERHLNERAEFFIRASARLGAEDQIKFAMLFERFLTAVNAELEDI